MTRENMAAEFSAARKSACGPGFSASPDDDRAVDALMNAHSQGRGFSPMDLLSLIQFLLPLLQDNLPALFELLKKVFSSTVK